MSEAPGLPLPQPFPCGKRRSGRKPRWASARRARSRESAWSRISLLIALFPAGMARDLVRDFEEGSTLKKRRLTRYTPWCRHADLRREIRLLQGLLVERLGGGTARRGPERQCPTRPVTARRGTARCRRGFAGSIPLSSRLLAQAFSLLLLVDSCSLPKTLGWSKK